MYLQTWVLIRANRMDDAIDAIPAYGKALLAKDAASAEEVCFRSHELGRLVGFMEEKALQKQRIKVDQHIEEVLEVFSMNEECQLAFKDGLHLMRARMRDEQLARDDKRGEKVESTEAELQGLKVQREDLATALALEQLNWGKIQADWAAAAKPLDEKLAAFEQNYQALQGELNGLFDDRAACKANWDDYQLVLKAATLEAGDTDATPKMLAAKADVLAEERRGAVLTKKITSQEAEMSRVYRQAEPFKKEREKVERKWKPVATTSDTAVKKLQKDHDRVARQVDIHEGKSVGAVQFDPTLVDFLPLDHDFQRAYLIDSFGVAMP